MDVKSTRSRTTYLRLADIAESGNRSHIDNNTGALLLHHGEDVMAAEVDRLEVDIALFVPRVGGHLGRSTGFGTTDIVDQNIDPAVLRHTSINKGFHTLVIGDVCRHNIADEAFGFKSPFGELRSLDSEVASEYLRSLTCHEESSGCPISPGLRFRLANTREEDDLVLVAVEIGHDAQAMS